MLLHLSEAIGTEAFGKKTNFIDLDVGEGGVGQLYVVAAAGLFAQAAVKVQVAVAVGIFGAFVGAQLITGSVLLLYAVYQPFFFEGFEAAVEGDAVDMTKIGFYLTERTRPGLFYQVVVQQNAHAGRPGLFLRKFIDGWLMHGVSRM